MSAYFDWAHGKADKVHRNIRLALLAVALSLAGCSAPPADEQVMAPIAALSFGQCGGALSLYVIVDQTHVIRFDPKQTTIFTVTDGHVTESYGPPTPFEQALKIAKTAGITSNTIAPCDKPGTST